MAQNRRRERQHRKEQRNQRIFIIALSAAALLISLVVSLIIAGPLGRQPEVQSAQSAMLPYDADMPFSAADLTSAQLEQIRRDGRMHVSDGPRSISIGDSLDKIIELFPTNYTGEQPEDEQILYCAEVFVNQNGVSTILPPRGLLTTDNSSIIVTLLAPLTPYPAGTKDNYRSYEHVYCLFTVEPDSMTVSEITLGLGH
ncbi:MAG: hypothetical protein IKU34_11755 [Clostridia bacterium]|nr:hypothetical protein [Clostridia bacterium]